MIMCRHKAKEVGYFSHPIRGAKGSKATAKDMRDNCIHCKSVAQDIERRFKSTALYIPAEHDDFVTRAFRNKILTDTQILDIDCEIVEECNYVLAYTMGLKPSSGMQREIDHAISKNIPIFFMAKNNAGSRKRFAKFLELVRQGSNPGLGGETINGGMDVQQFERFI